LATQKAAAEQQQADMAAAREAETAAAERKQKELRLQAEQEQADREAKHTQALARCAFSDRNLHTLEDAIGSHECLLEALTCV
jgi:hypothetical protein